MALDLRQNLKLSQQLSLSPQLQQAIKMLQLSRLELMEMVREEMLENPVLEEEVETGPEDLKLSHEENQILEEPLPTPSDHENQEILSSKNDELSDLKDFDWSNYLNQFNSFEPGPVANSGSDELPSFENTLSKKTTLYDHLISQIQLSNFSEEESRIAGQIICCLNDDGYLVDPLEEIATILGLPLEKIEAVLVKVQEFDPPGIAARNLPECLLIQIRHLGNEKRFVEKLITEHLGDLQRKDYRKIAHQMRLSPEKIYSLSQTLQDLEPRPGRPFLETSTEYVSPDVSVAKMGGEWVVMLNEDGMPKLRLSSFYQKMATNKQMEGETKEYVQGKLKSALWLIRSIHQRQRTLYKTMKAIVERQYGFFEYGVSALKPMILRDIAEEIGMHESTVSRVTTSKYVHTPHGIFELKFFFSGSFSSNDSGKEGTSSKSVREKIRLLVAAEDPKTPYSDQEISDLLKKEEIDIARRTVAKYREALKILPATGRKKIF